MDFGLSVLAGCLLESGKCVCGCIYPRIKSVLRFQSNLDELRKEMETLINLKKNVKGEIEEGEKDGHLARPTVVEWLKKVDEMENEVNLILMQPNISGTLCNYCPGCFVGCRRTQQLVKKLKEVKGLLTSGCFPSSSELFLGDGVVRKVEHIPGPSIEGQNTASKNLAKMVQLLDDENVRRIGVWGMGGVGKTTLVRHLNNMLQTSSLVQQPFSIVLWVTVSKHWDVRRIQTQIADRLNLEVRIGETMERTASRLHQRLIKEERFLLILDDVWEPINLDHLGIPQPEDHKGFKVILTSRNLSVCRRTMTNADVKVDVLDGEESWKLFTKYAGEVASLQGIEPFAKAVTRECGGLPLALIVVGASMRGKTMVELWKDALKALQGSVPHPHPHLEGIEDKVYNPLKWSYDALERVDMKSCFLYCALYPEDCSIEIKELVQSWLAEGLIDELQSYEDSFNRGIALVEKMKDCCLLECGVLEGTVKMHDVVRDVAIWIASYLQEECKSFIRSGIGLVDISEDELPESAKRVSFMDNKITELPHYLKESPKTSTLLLQGNLSLEIVPYEFLLAFKALRVLNLSETRVQELPHSFHELTELRALLLRRCDKLKELPPIAGLSKLQVLDLSCTSITCFPLGMENLTNLRQLNLSHTDHFSDIGHGIISKLSKLEVLDMTNSSYEWGRLSDLLSIFYELGSLNRLNVLYIHLNMSCFAKGSLDWFVRLQKFHFVIGHADEKSLVPGKYDEKRLTLCGLRLTEVQLGGLWNDASSLILDYCEELQLMHEYFGKHCNFNCLRSLTIMNYTIYGTKVGPFSRKIKLGDIPNLEELIIDRVEGLTTISDIVKLLRMKFPKLRLMRVANCGQLRYLFSVDDFITFRTLEEVTVIFCGELEGLFRNSSSSQTPVLPRLKFPNLRVLELKYLPEFRTLCGPDGLWQHLEQLEVIKCDRILKLPLTIRNAENIKTIRGESQWWSRLEWDEEETKLSLQHCFTPADN